MESKKGGKKRREKEGKDCEKQVCIRIMMQVLSRFITVNLSKNINTFPNTTLQY